MNKKFDYQLIDNLYMKWENERDIFKKKEIKNEIIDKISPYEFLMYSKRFSFTFEIFRKIFSLNDLLKTLEEMQMQGEDIKIFTKKPLAIRTPEDIKSLSNYARREETSGINNLCLIFNGNNIFKFGDTKSIGEKFSNTYCHQLTLEQIEEMLKSNKDYKGVPIMITIDNIGQLPLEKVWEIEKKFDISAIKIAERNRTAFGTNQGECTPLNLKTYKKIRTIVDVKIISKLYVKENLDKISMDLLLTAQIIDKIVNMIEPDVETIKEIDAGKSKASSENVMNASSLVGLLTKKSICKGYSEILRNVLSCVDIESTVIDGIGIDENGKKDKHSWNEVKMGDHWFNADIMFARKNICEGKMSGHLFMPYNVFYGKRRNTIIKNDEKTIGTVVTGGHISELDSKNRQSNSCINPLVILNLIQQSKSYAEQYKKNSESQNYKGVIPYIGSSIEKMRASSKSIETPGRYY